MEHRAYTLTGSQWDGVVDDIGGVCVAGPIAWWLLAIAKSRRRAFAHNMCQPSPGARATARTGSNIRAPQSNARAPDVRRLAGEGVDAESLLRALSRPKPVFAQRRIYILDAVAANPLSSDARRLWRMARGDQTASCTYGEVCDLLCERGALCVSCWRSFWQVGRVALYTRTRRTVGRLSAARPSLRVRHEPSVSRGVQNENA